MKKLLSLLFISALLPAFAAESAYSQSAAGNPRNTSVPDFRTYAATGYVPSKRNIKIIKKMKGKVSALSLLKFDVSTNNTRSMRCRVSFPIYGPNKTPFASLVEAAANMELAKSGLVAPNAPRVRATLDEFDFNSFGTGKWTIRVTLMSDGKAPLYVKHEYTYPVSAGAAAACKDVRNAMRPAIESFLRALYTNPRFVEFMQYSPS